MSTLPEMTEESDDCNSGVTVLVTSKFDEMLPSFMGWAETGMAKPPWPPPGYPP